MLYLDPKALLAAATLPELMDRMEQALLAEEEGKAILPLRTSVFQGEDTLMLMPCLEERTWGLKILTLKPGNPAQGRPYIDGLVVLFDGGTGAPSALMDGKLLTSLRTGAIGGLGIRHLSKPDTRSLGLVGAGVQGFWQARFGCAARDIREVWVLDAFPEKLPPFLDRLGQALPGVQVRAARSAEELLERTEAVMSATNASVPLYPEDPERLRGHCFVAIGSYRPDMHEVPDALFGLLDRVYVDTLHALEETGDLTGPLERGILRREDVRPLADLLREPRPAPETGFYKSVGGALFDLYAADLLAQTARAKGLGTELPQ